MAKIAPFRGFRYNPSVVGKLENVVTQPYDKIDDRLRQDYMNRSPYNLVNIIKGITKPNDTVNDNQYTRAREFWEAWIEDKALIRENGPAIYPYHQEFEVEGKQYVRKGIIALVDLSDKKLNVKAHELTLTGPKADRLNLLRATEANDGQIFMLYADKENKIGSVIENGMIGQAPIMTVKDDFGATHKLFRLTSPGVIRDLQELFEPCELYIADGHHRFETAMNYMNECRDRKWVAVGNESFNHRMMTMINMFDSGLVVLPTHRVIHSVSGFSPEAFLKKVATEFDVQSFDTREALFTAMDTADASGKHSIGFGAANMSSFALLTIKDPALMDKIVTDGNHSEAWRRLDVTILHSALLERHLGIDAKKLSDESNVHYVRGRDEALNAVNEDLNQCVFLLNPTKVQQVFDVASNGERMPQKSTDFYPKLLSGMVLMRMTIDKSAGLAVWKASE